MAGGNMMQEWYTALEFAKLGLPDCPSQKWNFQEKSKTKAGKTPIRHGSVKGAAGAGSIIFHFCPYRLAMRLVVRAYQANQNIETQENLGHASYSYNGEVDGRAGRGCWSLALLQDFVTQTGLTFKQARCALPTYIMRASWRGCLIGFMHIK